ncbi:BON domain-containing protein [Candidatus Nitrospira neomarina]|uniref:BON domain-containing protein n=1 Tax=Candidatus Nitrospira neomarina TaxID=3020899 RepID=A0AA96GN21_9BACT|nr:BON domain-containing protein [Candidatus Nitrospira neomarina]WNM62193.1 BON domain-containing protein [Candidatus Nitrospira neomarina]
MKHHSRDLSVMSLAVTLIAWSQVFGSPILLELTSSVPDGTLVLQVQDHQAKPTPKLESSEKTRQKPSDQDNIVQSQNLSLKLAFMEDSRLFPYEIDCRIQEKTVELRGEVSVEEEKTIVTAITTNLIKGKEIINHIEVRPSLRAAIQAKMDARLTELVKQRFAHSQTLREANFEIMTIRGVVSLSGRTRFQVIVLEGAQAAREIPGVIAVNTQNVRLEAGND